MPLYGGRVSCGGLLEEAPSPPTPAQSNQVDSVVQLLSLVHAPEIPVKCQNRTVLGAEMLGFDLCVFLFYSSAVILNS